MSKTYFERLDEIRAALSEMRECVLGMADELEQIEASLKSANDHFATKDWLSRKESDADDRLPELYP
jgi:hypothetical protein